MSSSTSDELRQLARALDISEAEAAYLVRFGTPANLAAYLSDGHWQRAPHLTYISNAVVEAVEGVEKRKVIEVPPRHGKSELISKWVPVWFLNRYPHKRVVLISYSLELAVEFGRFVRNTILEHAEELNVQIATDSQSAQRWSTTAGGGMISAGAGGPITGKGADLLIVDDPIKNDEEANSPAAREKLWSWWQSTVRTRLEPGSAAIVLHTRWNTDDLIGRLLQTNDNPKTQRRWQRIRFPAIAEEEDVLGRQPGAALWPARYDETELAGIEEDVGPYWWGALYQQNPVNRDGGYFNRAWFKVADGPAAGGTVVRFWDIAATDGAGDYTAGVKVRKRPDGTFLVEDVQHFRKSPAATLRHIETVAEGDGLDCVQWVEQEPGASGVYLIEQVKQELDAYRVKGFRATGNKESYWDAASPKCETGRVALVAAEWNKPFLAELEAVPVGKYDDQADAFAKALAVLSQKKRWGVLTDADLPAREDHVVVEEVAAAPHARRGAVISVATGEAV